MRTLPADLAHLTQLRKLFLDGNPDLMVPEAIEKLPCMAGQEGAEAEAKAMAPGLGLVASEAFKVEAASWK